MKLLSLLERHWVHVVSLSNWFGAHFSHISLREAISTRRRLSSIGFAVWSVSYNERLSLKASILMSLCCSINIISIVSDATKYVPQPSDKAYVSAAIVDLATHFNLIELQAICATLLYLLLNRILKPPWLPPFGRLLKLTSEYNLILSDSMSNVGMRILCSCVLYEFYNFISGY